MPCMKRVYRDQQATIHWSAAKKEEWPVPCGSTACQPRLLFFHRFTYEFLFSCSRRFVQDSCLRSSGGQEGRASPWRSDPSAFRALARRAAPCRVHKRFENETFTNESVVKYFFMIVLIRSTYDVLSFCLQRDLQNGCFSFWR